MSPPSDVDAAIAALDDRQPRSIEEALGWLSDVWQYFLDTGLRFAGGPTDATSMSRLGLIERVQEVATRFDSMAVRAEANRISAHVMNAAERYPDAVRYYGVAVPTLEALGHANVAAATRLGYAAALMMSGAYSEALAECAAADAWFVDHGDDNYHARVMVNTGNIYHRLDEHTRALECYFEAARVFERSDNKTDLAVISENIANSYSFIGEFDKSEAMYQRAEQLASSEGLSTLADQARYNAAYLQFLRGRYSDAIGSFNRLREQFKADGSVRHAALCDMDQSEIYLQLNLPEEASALAGEAREAFARLGMVYEEGRSIAFMGVAETERHRYQEALELFQQAAPLFTSEGNAFWTGMVELYRAEVLLALGRHWEARFLGESALERFDSGDVAYQKGMALIVLGRCAMAAGQTETLHEMSHELLSLVNERQVPLLAFPAYMLCGQIAEQASQHEQARRLYALAADSIEEHRAYLHHDELRVRFLDGKSAVYESLVALDLDNNNAQSAYHWCERAKARALADLLGQHLPAIRTEGSPELLEHINRLREELTSQYVHSRPDGEAPVSRARIAETERQLEHRLRQLSTADDRFGALFGVVPRSAEKIREVLPQDTTLVEFFIARGELVAFVMDRERVSVHRRLAIAERIEQLAQNVEFQMQKFALGDEYVSNHQAAMLASTRGHLQALFDVAIAPWLDDVSTANLVIVPHEALHMLPLHAAFDGTNYLCDRFYVTYSPSAEVFCHTQSVESRPTGHGLLVGQADASAPAIDQEIARLSALVPDRKVLTDAAATRDALFQHATVARFVHISTHSYFRRDNPMFSGFNLADGAVTALDLYSQSWSSELVTLSGCSSGLAGVAGGDDLMGLVRGFLHAGARTLLMSMWNVSDAATASLVASFYEAWLEHGDKARALTHAMAVVRQQQEHPFYWAPFVLIGAR